MLLLIRTEARRAEFAMCMALGASRARLARGIAIEGALLAAAGSLAALPVAWWLFGLIRVFQLPGNISVELLELSLDTRALAVAIGAAAAAVLLIALVAGVFGFRADVADGLRARAGVTPLHRRATRATLVGAQVAVAVTLVGGRRPVRAESHRRTEPESRTRHVADRDDHGHAATARLHTGAGGALLRCPARPAAARTPPSTP